MTLGDGVGVESTAAVADEQHDHVAIHFCIEGNLGCTGPLGGIDGCLPRCFEQRPQPVGQLAVTYHHYLDGDTVIGFDLALEYADAFGQHGRILADGSRRPALEQPRAKLALLGAGQLHHVLGVIGGALDEGERLQDRVVHMGRHSGPLFGHRPGLALCHQIAHQTQPPGPEGDHDGSDDQ